MTWHFGCWGEDAAASEDARSSKQWETLHGEQGHRDGEGLMAEAAQHILGRRVTIGFTRHLPPTFVIYESISPHLQRKSKHRCYHRVEKLQQSKLTFFCSGSSPCLKDKGKTKWIENNIFSANNC